MINVIYVTILRGGKRYAAIVVVRTLFEEWLEQDRTQDLTRLLFREVPVSDLAERYSRVSPLCGPPGGHAGAYVGGMPNLGEAPPCPPGGE